MSKNKEQFCKMMFCTIDTTQTYETKFTNNVFSIRKEI